MLVYDYACVSFKKLFFCRCQVCSQRGVQVSVGHPIADFGHSNIHIFCVKT